MSTFPFRTIMITVSIYIQLLWQIRGQYTTIWFDTMASNSGNWGYRSSSYTQFGYSSNYGCFTGRCCRTEGGWGNDEWAVKPTDISWYSSIRLELDISTWKMYSGSTCDVYYSYTSSSSSDRDLVLSINPPDSSSSRYHYGDQVIDFPDTSSASTIYIWLYSNSPSSSLTDYCYWDNVELKGIRMPGAPTKEPTQSPSPSPTPAPTPSPTPPPTKRPTDRPTQNPTGRTSSPTPSPTPTPTPAPTPSPSVQPTDQPTQNPTGRPTVTSAQPTLIPTGIPTANPTGIPTTPNPTETIVAVAPTSSTTSSTVVNETEVRGGGIGNDDDTSSEEDTESNDEDAMANTGTGNVWSVMAGNWLVIIAVVSVLICCMAALALFILRTAYAKGSKDIEINVLAASGDKQAPISTVNSASSLAVGGLDAIEAHEAQHEHEVSDSEIIPDLPDPTIPKQRMHVLDDSFGGIGPGGIEEVIANGTNVEMYGDGEDSADESDEANEDMYAHEDVNEANVERMDYVMETPMKPVAKELDAIARNVAQCIDCGEVKEGKMYDADGDDDIGGGQFYCNECWAQYG